MGYLAIKGQVFSLDNADESEYTIGRHKSCAVSIDNFRASRFHAMIKRCDDGRYLIADTSSQNGLFVNGRMIDVCVLRSRDAIKIGDDIVIFYAGSPEHMQSGFQTIASAA